MSLPASSGDCRDQLSIAKLPLAKDIDDFDFANTPVNEELIRDLARAHLLPTSAIVVLVGGTGTGKSHLAIAIARAVIRNGTRGRFFSVVDLVNRLETETRSGKQGRMADYLNRLAGTRRPNFQHRDDQARGRLAKYRQHRRMYR